MALVALPQGDAMRDPGGITRWGLRTLDAGAGAVVVWAINAGGLVRGTQILPKLAAAAPTHRAMVANTPAARCEFAETSRTHPWRCRRGPTIAGGDCWIWLWVCCIRLGVARVLLFLVREGRAIRLHSAEQTAFRDAGGMVGLLPVCQCVCAAALWSVAVMEP